MITFRKVHFSYPDTSQAVLKNVNLAFGKGSFTLVAGDSGTGKSTLLRCIDGLVPHFTGGTIGGEIRVAGCDPIAAGPQKMSRFVGFVFQDPEAQFVLDRVEEEIAFALENAAWAQAAMQQRMAEVLALLDITRLKNRDVHTLSGGESQKVAIASALALRPQVLVLDEPTSQLDPQSAKDVLDAVFRLNRELGLTIVIAEHRLERVLPYADQLVFLTGHPAEPLCGASRKVLAQMRRVPPVVSLGKRLGWSPLPLAVEEARRFSGGLLAENNASGDASGNGKKAHLTASAGGKQPAAKAPPVRMAAQNLHAAYDVKPVLRGVSIELRSGEIVCLVGQNGSGKTTLLKALTGLIEPQSGKVTLNGEDIAGKSVAEICRQVGYLPQDPNTLLFAETVREELFVTLQNHHLVAAWGEARAGDAVDGLLRRLGLKDKTDAYPRDLSVGERQRVALGAITITAPGVLLLDEPTRGLDYRAKEVLGNLLKGWKEEGLAILLVTHDVELVAAIADRLVCLRDGTIVADGAPAQVFPHIPGFLPQMLRLFPGYGLLTVDHVCAALARADCETPKEDAPPV